MTLHIAYCEEKDFDTEKNAQENITIVTSGEVGTASRARVNASGHVDQLDRQYGLLSICATALTIDNAWVALGGSITVAVANGGAPGIIYEFLASSVYYGFVAMSIAELASSIPSAGGVYHWSLVAGGKYGRSIAAPLTQTLTYRAGLINFYGWLFGLASGILIPANVVVQMYVVFHPDVLVQPWHIFVAFVLINWFCCLTVIFFNRYMPALQRFGLFMIIVGGLVTIIVLASAKSHASASFVFTDWENGTGWPGGVAFLTGMLNGAFAIGTPDSVTHMAEELPHPRRDLPKAVAAQILLGALTGFVYAVALMFSITDLDAVLTSNGSFPLAVVYAQATGNKAGTFGLLLIVLLSVMPANIGGFITTGRIYWALARDNVTPFSSFFSQASALLSCPVPATVFCAILTTAFGAVQLGSKTALADLGGSFIILSTTSYAMAILPHLLSGRKNVPQGPFWMGRAGFFVNTMSVLLIVFTNVIFCLPYALPATVPAMNYNSVILIGCVALTTFWWIIHGRTQYPGPCLPHLDAAGHKIDDEI
ncbi:choline transport protein [Mycena albidolilacea]|uniref:Choline transport protein n=1 Tax=Mycena albidolilacea TaxID=1033008 RepID=A0AAD7ENA4_9AGAR|nr:choline transport protein [Mycena albidolilacea]